MLRYYILLRSRSEFKTKAIHGLVSIGSIETVTCIWLDSAH